MDYNEFKALYEAKAKKYKLPPFDKLDHEFEIYDIFVCKFIPPTHLLRNTRRFMGDRLWGFVNFLHNFLAPNQQSLILMEEAKKFSEAEKKEISELMRKLTILARKGSIIEMKLSEKEDAAHISEVYNAWQTIKPDVTTIVDKNLERWSEEEKEDKAAYYG